MAAPREVEFRRRKLAAAFKRAEDLRSLTDPAELEAQYARYLCVLVSGFVERSVAEIIMNYAEGKTAQPLLLFVESALKRLANVDKERLLAVIGDLDSSWRVEIDAYVTDERQAALNSVVGLRNNIAHGGDAGISLAQIERYWVAVQEVVDKVASVVLTTPPRSTAGAQRAATAKRSRS